jgi:hypothetical protein
MQEALVDEDSAKQNPPGSVGADPNAGNELSSGKQQEPVGQSLVALQRAWHVLVVVLAGVVKQAWPNGRPGPDWQQSCAAVHVAPTGESAQALPESSSAAVASASASVGEGAASTGGPASLAPPSRTRAPPWPEDFDEQPAASAPIVDERSARATVIVVR